MAGTSFITRGKVAVRRLPESKCLSCGIPLVAATGVKNPDDLPSEGDVSVCAWCGNLAVYDSKLKLRSLTDKEVIEVAGHKDILIAQKAIANVKKRKMS
jgi:hypothetical protein